MTTTLPKFGFSTTAKEVASALSSRITGKTILITGISKGGLGFETARVIALHKPKLLVLAGRNQSKNEEAKSLIEKEAKDVNIKLLKLDLGSFAAVRQSAENLKGWNWEGNGIDVVINNAAIM
jgi:NAD(P)-dependent dehydrogenase (short-subunit alcohol dehydrogenase family)